jgi:acetyltransferase-like isoleucine patch superfamily enzyme
MNDRRDVEPGRWTGGPLPLNVRLGPGTIVTGDRWTEGQVFRKFLSRKDPALVIGAGCRMDGVLFNVNPDGVITIGDHCSFEEVYLVCEDAIRIGHRVVMGWRSTIVDSDFHPLDPATRRLDAIACSPLGDIKARPAFQNRPVLVEDDVWIGPHAAILKGVRVGAGAFVEPGAVVVHDVPPRSRVQGNPARVVGQV